MLRASGKQEADREMDLNLKLKKTQRGISSLQKKEARMIELLKETR